jgi:hypothetical protein
MAVRRFGQGPKLRFFGPFTPYFFLKKKPHMQNFNHDEIIRIMSRRGKPKILYQGYAYNLRREMVDKDIWRCRYGTCTSHLSTTKEMALISVSDHNHEANFENNQIMAGLEQMMVRVSETSERPRDIIHNAIDGSDDFVLHMAPITKSLTNKIKRSRNKRHTDSIPQQSDIPTSIRNLSSKEIFLQFDSGIEDTNRIIIFCSDENLLHLEYSKILLADGTFKSAPNGFKQLYTLVVYLNGVYVPLVFVLMYTKNEISYTKICDFLEARAPKFNPEFIILEADRALLP